MLQNVLIVLLCYFLGNCSTSYLVGKTTANIDIRKHGSGNAGSTNVLRTLGIKSALVTFIGDTLKGIIAIYIGMKFDSEILMLLCGIAVVLGHNWPILLKFKGGKGIATTLGVFIAINPIITAICFIISLIIVYFFRYVSLASISLVTILSITMLFSEGIQYFIFALALWVLAVYKHKDNIGRLLKGTERKLGEKSPTNK